MAKQLNVDMRFTANTSQAKKAIDELNASLSKLGYGSAPQGVLSQDFEKASAAARELSMHLNNAFNMKTGNLDLHKLNSSLQSSGTSLQTLTSNFKNAGEVGQQAFVALSRAIASADQPTITLNTRLSTLWTTLKNVARFQMSSSIMHGLIGGIQTAYGYAQDLNSSLNNIRIVTGQSTEQMAQFADQANKAARSLSSTTLDYTNAALIYYQQGLSDTEVRERTDVTIKMANVARESAETVSEQLTAIWNNFDDGSKSLEYYADVITALGAATASSSSEISAGLNKFAAVADTVGLSYENATAALATITATTRQSADTVGTGLRTLFSRLQGLSLGETLEDGVNLNKYSKALQTVGVDALDASGNLRRMDDVLEDLGERWGQLSKAEQTALAQTVGGVRQYTTLIALMDSWDFMKQNQQVAAGAKGTLQEQAEIYAESWEAARDRVKAATQAIYKDLIDDQFFINFTKGIEQVLSGIDRFIDNFGGVRNIILGIGSVILGMISNKIGPAIQKTIQDIQILSGGSSKVYTKMQKEFSEITTQEIQSGNYTEAQKAELQGNNALLIAKTKYSMVSSQMSDKERMQNQLTLQGIELQAQRYKELTEARVNATKKAADAENKVKQIHDQIIDSLQKEQQELEKTKKEELDRQKNLNKTIGQEYGTAKATLSRSINSDATDRRFIENVYETAKRENILSANDLDFSNDASIMAQIKNSGYKLRQALFDAMGSDSTASVSLSNSLGSVINKSLTKLTSTDQIPEMQAKFQAIYSSFSSVIKSDEGLSNAFKNVNEALKTGDIDNYNSALATLKQRILDTNIPATKANKLLSALGADTGSVDRYTQAIQKRKKAQEELAQSAEKVKKIEEELRQKEENQKLTLEELAEKNSKLKTALQEKIQLDEEAKKAIEEEAKAQETLNQRVAEFQPQHMMSGIEGLTKTASSLGQIVMSFNAFKSVWTTLTDENATTGEQITAFLTGISMGVPSAISAITQLIGVFKNLHITSMALNATEMLMTTVKDKNTAAQIRQVVAENTSLFTKKALSNENKIQAATELLVKKGIDEKTASEVVNSIATGKLTVATTALNASLATTLAIVGALIVIIGGLVIAYKAIKANSPEGQLKAANDELERAKTAAEEAKNSYNNLLSTIENYNNAQNAIKDLTTGTEKFANQIKEANDYAQELINTFGLVYGSDWYFDSNGAIIFNKGVLEEKTKDAAEQVENTKAIETYDTIDQYEKDLVVKKQKINNRLGLGIKEGEFGYIPPEEEAGRRAAFEAAANNGTPGAIMKAFYQAYSKENPNADVYERRAAYNRQKDDFFNSALLSDYKYLTNLEGIDLNNFRNSEWLTQLQSDLSNEDNYQLLQQNRLTNALINQITPKLISELDTSVYDGLSWNYDRLIEEYERRSGKQWAGKRDPELVKTELAKMDVAEQNEDLAQPIIDNLNQIFDNSKNINGKDYSQIVANLLSGNGLKGLSQEQLASLNGLEFSDLGLSNDILGNLGITTSLGKLVENATANYRPSAQEYSRLESNILEAEKVIAKKLEKGKAISDEDYQILGDAAKGYFVQLADGTWQLTGEAENLVEVLHNAWKQEYSVILQKSREGLHEIEQNWNNRPKNEIRSLDQIASAAQSAINSGESNAYTNGNRLTTSRSFIQAVAGDKQAEAFDNGSLEERNKILQETINQFSLLKEQVGTLEQQIASLATNTSQLQEVTEQNNLSSETQAKQLMLLGSQYEECSNEVYELNLLMINGETSGIRFQRAMQKLWDVVRHQEWEKLGKEIAEYLNVIKDTTSTEEARTKAYKNTAAAFNKAFNTKIDTNNIEQYQKKFDELANASDENANDIAENIVEINKANNILANDDSVQNYVDNFNNLTADLVNPADNNPLDQLKPEEFKSALTELKAYIDANPLEVNAEGHADLGPLLSEFDGTAKEAQLLAAKLAAIGQTNVRLNFDADSFANFDLNTEKGIQDFINALSSWEGGFEANGDQPVIQGTAAPEDFLKPADKGGGGGGSAKTHTKKQRDNNDRYKPILAKQEDKKRQIDAAKDRADRLAGQARIDNLREENKLLGDNIELQKEYINEITNYLAQDKSDMINQLGSFGLSVNFDENGVINNYDALMDRLYAIYNEKANQAMDEDAWKDFEESWQNAIDSVNQYIETRDLEEEQQENLTDMLNEQFDQLLEMANTKLELNLQVNDADLELLDHLINKIDDDAYKAAEAIALMGDKAARELERANYYQNAINQTLSAYGLESVDDLLNMSPEDLQNLGITQDTVDNMIDWNSELLSITETLDDMQKEIREKVIDSFDELNEKVQDSYDFFSHYNTILENYRNIADLNTAAIGKEARALIRSLDNSMLRNSQNALRSSKAMYDKLVEDRQIAQQKLNDAVANGLIGEADEYRDLLDNIDGQIRDAQEQWLADWEDGLQKAADILERSVDDAVKNYEELLAPLYGSLDSLNDVYEMRKEVDEDYVQDYEKLYQLNKLNRDLGKTLNEVQGVQNRQQLLALQEKINKLQKDGTKMSEYDLQVLEKEFEVQQARIALEEVANAKSTVRLQRDNEGNWGYVYSADSDTIEEAQQNYEDKLYEYQKLNDEYIREMEDKLMDLSQTAKDKIADVWADSTLSPEEKQAKTDEIVAWFNAQRDFISSQMEGALQNQADLTQRFYDTYQNTYAEVMDTYEETMLAEATKIQDLDEWLGILNTGFSNLLDEVKANNEEYLASIEEINQTAGSSIQELATDITAAEAEIDKASLENIETINELAQAVQDNLVATLDSAIEQEAKLANEIASTTEQIEKQAQAWNNVMRALNGVEDAANVANYPLETLARSTEKYGLSQPSYNPNDWEANEAIDTQFNNIYDQNYWQEQHRVNDELYDSIQDWLNVLSMQALTAMGGFGTMTSPYYKETEDGTLQQEVHIDANFPNVTDRSQIEEAFDNLVNKAAQFANRKRQG